jgi:hypothetical protein
VYEKKVNIEEQRNQILSEENRVITAEEEKESFVHKKIAFDKTQKVSKKLKYWCNCAAIGLCLKNFQSC